MWLCNSLVQVLTLSNLSLFHTFSPSTTHKYYFLGVSTKSRFLMHSYVCVAVQGPDFMKSVLLDSPSQACTSLHVRSSLIC